MVRRFLLRFAYMAPLMLSSKKLVFLSAIPIAIFLNFLRLTATAIMAHRIGAKAAEGFLHEMSGLLVFVVTFVLLFLISLVLAKIEKRMKTQQQP